MKSLNAEEALQIWQDKGLLTKQKVSELKRALSEKGKDEKAAKTGRGIVIFSTIGAILVGVGILLFIGSNWGEMSPLVRAFVLFLGYGVICAGAYVSGQHGVTRVSESLWFLANISFGANIFFLAQLFHHSLTYWQGPLLWMIGTLAMGYARQRSAYAWLAVPLGLLALGWIGGGSGWFMDDQMEFLIDERGLRALLPLIGLALASLAVLLRPLPSWKFADQTWIGWGVVLATMPVVVAGIHAEVAQHVFHLTFTVKQVIVLIACYLLIIGASASNLLRSSYSRGALLVCAALVSLLLIQKHADGEAVSLIGYYVESSAVAFSAFLLVVFALCLSSLWIGNKINAQTMMQAGLAGSVLMFAGRYASSTSALREYEVELVIYGFLLMGTCFLVLASATKDKLASQDAKQAGLLASGVLALMLLQKHAGGSGWYGEQHIPLFWHLASLHIMYFILFLVLVFSASLYTISLGLRMQDPRLVNAGVFGTTAVIIVQYFSWSFEMLHSSIAFIVGGIVLIALSIFMERTRRKLLSRLQTA